MDASKNNAIEFLHQESVRFQELTQEMSKVIVGQQDTIHFILIAILCKGHVLLEGVPGVAKTTMIKTLAQALGLQFARIQFTPDLLPADLLGTLIYNTKTQEFETRKGPIFANLVLADEINRAPAKVQSALLEAMQERQVTIGSTTYPLDEPFLVFATQNPIEQEGTYRLPEAQVDRFMFKLTVTYPTRAQEKEILKKDSAPIAVQQVLTRQEILATQQLVDTIYCDDKILDYITHIVGATRDPGIYNAPELKRAILVGASPRATLTLYHAAKAQAFLKKRHFVTPDDVKAIAIPALAHRIILSYEAEAEGITREVIVNKILGIIPAP